MKTPLVSIVIPTFNRPQFLERAVSSAKNQTYSNIEVIVVDDHSDLDIRAFKKKFPDIQFFQNSENKGPCYSRNRGLEEAEGEYINFLDDDDELYPEKIELQVNKYLESNQPNLGMVTCHVLDCRSGNQQIIKNDVKGDLYRELLSKFAVAGTEAMLFKKSVFDEINGFDENLESSQEYDLFIRVSEKYRIDYVDKVLTRKNRSHDQISLNFEKKISGAKLLFRKHDRRYRKMGLLFWIKMRLKLYGLLGRYLIGKCMGEKMYRLTIKK